jgi:tetraprenyl-beta-curcumene synthase
VRGWRSLAETIPDAPIREDALSALRTKRGQTDGAALLSSLTRKRNTNLLRLLVAYQIIWDFLDSVHEHDATGGERNGRQLHLALIDALDPDRPIADYYRHHPWHEDGGYLQALVLVCRECCAGLPSYHRVQQLVLEQARHAQAVLSLNHSLDPHVRDTALQAWSASKFPGGQQATWFELSGAASAGLTIFALLALAADTACDDAEIQRTYHTYFPWTSAAATMLDSYVDQIEDAATGEHIYISHYPSVEQVPRRIQLLIQRCLCEAQRLRNAETHTLIATSMIALYLSKDSARTQTLRGGSKTLAAAGGSLTRVLVPMLRLWRSAYAQSET